MQPSSFWPLLLQFYQQCELWKHLRIWHMLRFHFTLTHYRHQHLKITRVSISIYLGLLHYVRVSQFYWHFCKSTNFPIELALKTGILLCILVSKSCIRYILRMTSLNSILQIVGPWDHIAKYILNSITIFQWNLENRT